MSASRYITSALRYHPCYQSRSSMYIRGLIPRNWPRQFRLKCNNDMSYVYILVHTKIVPFKVLFLCKTFMTNVTVIGPLASMYTLMSHQMLFRSEHFWKKRTRKHCCFLCIAECGSSRNLGHFVVCG